MWGDANLLRRGRSNNRSNNRDDAEEDRKKRNCDLYVHFVALAIVSL